MFVKTALETTDVTSTLCSVTQVLPHSQMLVFVVFHTYMHTMLPSNCPLNDSGTVTGQVILKTEPYLLYTWNFRA